MNKDKGYQMQWKAASLALLVALLGVGFFGTTGRAAARGVQQSVDELTAPRAFAAAYNNHDVATLRSMADPSFLDIYHYGPPDQQVNGIEAFIKGDSQGPHVDITSCKQIGTDMVTCDAVLSGGPIPVLPHPFSGPNTFTFRNGKIVRLDEYLSDQTAKDLAAYTPPQPGMPSTGSRDFTLPLSSVLLCLLLVGAGLFILRAQPASR